MLYNKPKQMQHMLLHLSGQPLAFSNWYHGEPNNLGNEDCVHVYTYAGGKWNDLPCNVNNVNVLCEALLPKGDS